MSLYNTKDLTSHYYEMVNPTNSDSSPFTETGKYSDAIYRGAHTAQTPTNPMKGGYTYKNANRKSYPTKRTKKSKKNTSISSVLGMDVSYRGKAGRSKRRMSRRSMSRYMGMTLSKGMAGGRHRRKQRGGISPFPEGYSLGGHMNPNLNALANPPIYTPYYN
jgi:hypothetical protein